uniref:Uncharacterized protein n=2 Tax=viral metagenome TaxID=1070528 RepID=A0A6M3KLQ2_9ZZZZ
MTISFGSKSVFRDEYVGYVGADMIDASTFVVAYFDQEIGDYSGYAIAGRIEGTSLSFGEAVEFDTTGYNYHNAVCRLTDTTFVLCYEDNWYDGVAIIGNLSGTTITFGSPQYYESEENAGKVGIARLSDTLFAIAYEGGYVRVGSVDGTVITWGDRVAYDITTGHIDYLAITPMSATTFVLVYRSDAVYDNVAVVGTVDGTAIVLGSASVFSDFAYDMAVAKITDTTFVVSYAEDTPEEGRARVGTVTGSVITFGDVYTFSGYGPLEYVSIARLSDTSFVFSYRDYGASYAGKTVYGDVAGTVITFQDPVMFSSAISVTHSTMRVSNSVFIIAFRDQSNTYKGTAIVGVVLGPPLVFDKAEISDVASGLKVSWDDYRSTGQRTVTWEQ